LKLWINDQTVSLRVIEDATILNRYSIWWESIHKPLSTCSIICENIHWVRILTHWDIVIFEEWNELAIQDLVSELFVEWSDI